MVAHQRDGGRWRGSDAMKTSIAVAVVACVVLRAAGRAVERAVRGGLVDIAFFLLGGLLGRVRGMLFLAAFRHRTNS